MWIDGSFLFTGTSNGASGGITASAYADAPTTGTQVASNIVDIGVKSGVPAFSAGGGARDLGIGDDPSLKLMVISTVAFVGGTSLQVVLSGAPDNGSGLPGSYTAMWTGPAIAVANLIAGAALANIDVPRVIPGQPAPRFLQLSFISVGTFTGGNVEGAVVLDRFDQPLGSSGALSGFVPGIAIAN